MRKWYDKLFLLVLFVLIMYYFLINDVTIFHVMVGVFIFCVGLSTYMFSLTSYKLKNYNIMTRYAPPVLVASFFNLLHAVSEVWHGEVIIDKLVSAQYFLVLAGHFLSFGLLLNFLYRDKVYDHKRQTYFVILSGVVLGLIPIITPMRSFISDPLYIQANLWFSSLVFIYILVKSTQVDVKYVREIRFIRFVAVLFLSAFIIHSFGGGDILFFVDHMLLLSGYLAIIIYTVKRNINDTMLEKYNHLAVEIERLESNNASLRQSEKIFRSLYEDAPIGYQSLDIEGNLLFVNNAYAEMLGYSVHEMIGKKFNSFMTEKSQKKMPSCFTIFKRDGEIDTMFDMVKKNGKIVTVRFVGKVAHHQDGTFRQTHCILMDVTNEVEYQNKLMESKERISSILESTAEGIIGVNNNGYCNFINAKGLELLRLKDYEVIGEKLHKVFHGPKQKTNPCDKKCTIMQMSEDNVYYSTDSEKIYRTDGSWFAADISNYPQTKDGELVGTVFTFRDITSKQELSMSLLRMSYNDHLTGLYNRRYFEKELITLDKRENYPLTIINSDINGLKLINDAFGHQAGDELLIKAARVINNHLKPTDLVARIGGDEFVIIMPNTSEDEAEAIIKTITDEAKKITVNFIELSISFGYATKYKVTEDIQKVYKEAEDAMYREKLLKLPSMRSSAINTVLNTLNEKDPNSEDHSRRVSNISASLAKAMGLPQQKVQLVKTAGLLHDIGKIVIPTSIIQKDGKLTREEFEIVKKHPEIGYRILNSTDDMSEIAQIVLSHHEWVSGSGYPRGIAQDEIPLLARIISVADAFDAMTSERSYRQRVKNEVALEELLRCAGTQFDMEVVSAFKNNFTTIIRGD